MLFRRSVCALPRRAVLTPIPRRAFTHSAIRRKQEEPDPAKDVKTEPKKKYQSTLDPIPGQTDEMIPFDQVKSYKDLVGPGAAPGTVPSDLEQATGLERFEILGKMHGIDVFDMKPLDSSRVGTLAGKPYTKGPQTPGTNTQTIGHYDDNDDQCMAFWHSLFKRENDANISKLFRA
ncbi:MAG: hypothetical protein Q9174_003778 [Haloplaca sp. 1 TL-2023]